MFKNVTHSRATLIIISSLIFALVTISDAAGALGELGQEVVPLSQVIELKLDPRQPDYTGLTTIQLEVKSAVSSFQFHAENMELQKLTMTGPQEVTNLSYEINDRGLVTVTTGAELSVGKYELKIEFSNDFDTQARSLYRLEVNDLSYAFTQFEPDDAREAFPCWDEPIFKIPYQLILTVPIGMDAVANTMIESSSTVDGWKRVVFRQIMPTPSYLLAMAVGEFEYAEIPGMSIPGRVITVKGQIERAGEAIRATPPILKALEDYFGQPYPYEKLDLIGVPEYWAGAMENPGLITYRETALLADPASITVRKKLRIAAITAHELAHMWFGDLVTMEWWDDLWLNESFASWMGNKITHEVFPQYRANISAVSSSHRAMLTDQKSTTHPVRQELLPTDNLNQAFDALAYSKGQAVLAMFENWIGAEKFRTGVVNYIKAHQWGNANGVDFWQALAEASSLDMNSTMGSFLDQAGVPMISLEIVGDGMARLTQSRFRVFGTEDGEEHLWQIPVQLKYSDGVTVYNKTLLLTEKTTEVPLPTEGRLEWVFPNLGALGYYRWNWPAEMLVSMAAQAPRILETPERVGFINNLTALLDAGVLAGGDYLKVLNAFADDPDPQVVSALISSLGKINSAFITAELENDFAAYVRKTLGPALKRFGMIASEGEEETVTMFRPKLLGWLADEGKDEEVLKFAVSLAEKYNKDPLSIDPSMANTAVYLSAINGDRALFEDYKHRFETSTDPTLRSRYLSSLGDFRDPALVKEALAYVFTGDLRPHELFSIPFGVGDYRANEDLLFEWMKDNFENYRERVPEQRLSFMPYFAGGCSRQRLEAATDYFEMPEHQVNGTELTLKKVAASVNDCASLREREGDAVEKYLGDVAASN